LKKKEGNTVHLVHNKQPPKSKLSLFIIKKFIVQHSLFINADGKLCLIAGHTKTHGEKFSYRRPLPTPPTNYTKSSSAAPPQDHSKPAASATKPAAQNHQP
jgi:hypothetical protein